MKKRNIFVGLFTALFVLSFLTFTGCENGNLFGKLTDSGGGSPEQILQQADTALQERNFALALALYRQILAGNPGNARANYGVAAALVLNTGVDLGTLLSNITNQVGTSGVNDLYSLVQTSSFVSGSQTPDPNGLLNGLPILDLQAILNEAICRLRLIIAGATDGSIPTGDIDVILNLASLCALRAAIEPFESSFFEIIRDSNGDLSVNTSGASAFCDPMVLTGSNLALLQQFGRDLLGTYMLFREAVTLLNLTGNQIIVQLQADIDNVARLLLVSGTGSTLPTNCIMELNNIGITYPLPTSNRDVFNNPGTCPVSQ